LGGIAQEMKRDLRGIKAFNCKDSTKRGTFSYCAELRFVWIPLILLKTENNKKVTVHTWVTIHLSKCIVHVP